MDPRTCLPPHSLVLQQTMQAGRGPEVASLWGPLLPGWGGRGWARAELCIRKPEPARCPGAGGGCWGLRSACRKGGREGSRLCTPPPHPGPGGPWGTMGDYGGRQRTTWDHGGLWGTTGTIGDLGYYGGLWETMGDYGGTWSRMPVFTPQGPSPGPLTNSVSEMVSRKVRPLSSSSLAGGVSWLPSATFHPFFFPPPPQASVGS